MDIIQTIGNFIIPHSGNNHRAKALHLDILMVYVLLFAIFNIGLRIVHKNMPDILGYATDIRIHELLLGTNNKRIEAGLGTLTLNESLNKAAAAKAADMFANNYWAHNSPSGKTPWDFIIANGYSYTLAGENLAKNFQTSAGVIDAWMASETHRDNIVKSGYREVGFAIVNGILNGEETTLVVQMFGATNAKTVAKIPQVQAQAIVPDEPVVSDVPEVAVPVQQEQEVFEPANISVITAPKVNIESFTHKTVYAFVVVLLAVLLVDLVVVQKRRIVRLVGHNFAHFIFLATIIGYGFIMIRGNLI